MKTKVKIFFAIFPLLLVLVLFFRSGLSLNDVLTQLVNITGSEYYFFGILQGCIHNLFFDFLGIGELTSAILSWYFSYIILVSIGFLLYDLFVWFGSFVKTFRA